MSCSRVLSEGPEHLRLGHVSTFFLVTGHAWSLRVETSFLAQALVQVSSWTSRISTTCKIFRNANSWAPHRHTHLGPLGGGGLAICVLAGFQVVLIQFKFENHTLSTIRLLLSNKGRERLLGHD